MGMINSMDDILKALTDGRAQKLSFFFDNRIGPAAGPSTTAGQMSSCWRLNKSNGANGKAPDNVTYLSEPLGKSTLGAIPFKAAGVDRKLYLTGFEGGTYMGGTIVLYDRLCHAGPLLANMTEEQGLNVAPTRYNTTGEGNEIWLEVFTQIGATQTSCTVTYLNQDNVEKVTPLTFIGGTNNREESRIVKFALAEGDTGVRKLVSFKLNGSTGTAGNMAVILARPVVSAICEVAGNSFYRDCISGIPSVPIIDNDACLAMAVHACNAGSMRGNVMLHLIEV